MDGDDDVARIRFTDDFDWHPTPRTTIAYLSGMEVPVKRACCDAAVAAGKGVEVSTPNRDQAEDVPAVAPRDAALKLFAPKDETDPAPDVVTGQDAP